MTSVKHNSLITFSFWFLFIFCFLLSGIISYFGVLPGYKLGYLPALLIPLFFFTLRVKKYFFYLIYFFIILVIILSSAINNSNLLDMLLYLRYPIFFFLIAWLVDQYLTRDNLPKTLHVITILIFIQLPVVIIQRIFATQLVTKAAKKIASYDFVFGTFNFSSDCDLAFFCLCLVALILNNKAIRRLIPNFKIIFILSIVIVFITNAEMIKMMLVLTILLSVFKKQAFYTIIFLIITSSLMIIIISIFFPQVGLDFYKNFNSLRYVVNEILSFFDARYYKNIYTEGFSRPAVIKYAFSQPLSWLGTGPHSVYNPISGLRRLPTTDTFIISYFEIGLLGLISICILFFNTFFRPFSKQYSFSIFQITMFLSFIALCFTVPIFPSIDILMTIFIFLKIYTLIKIQPSIPIKIYS